MFHMSTSGDASSVTVADVVQHRSTVSFANASSPTSAMVNADPVTLRVFLGCVIVMGFVGSLTNGWVCYVLTWAEWKKRGSVNLLILNQICIDLLTSVFLVVTYGIKFNNHYHSALFGFGVCAVFFNEMIIWVGYYASTTCIVMIDFEKFTKVIYPMRHKRHFRRWMIFAAVSLYAG